MYFFLVCEMWDLLTSERSAKNRRIIKYTEKGEENLCMRFEGWFGALVSFSAYFFSCSDILWINFDNFFIKFMESRSVINIFRFVNLLPSDDHQLLKLLLGDVCVGARHVQNYGWFWLWTVKLVKFLAWI